MMLCSHGPAALSLPPAAITSLAPTAAVPTTADPGVHQVEAMFDKVLSLCNASLAAGRETSNHQPLERKPFRRHSVRPRNQQHSEPVTCRVCGSTDHSTHAQCRLYRLCLNCLNPGHVRLECPYSSSAPPQTKSTADLN